MILKRTVAMFHFLTVLLMLLNVPVCNLETPIKITGEHLAAKEGSCITIKCTVTSLMKHEQDQWFWMKNAKWNDIMKDFTGTIVISNTKAQTPAPEFADRVKYIGSVNFGQVTQSDCSLLINNLEKTDSGIYTFRYIGKNDKWMTEAGLNLTVEDDPCQVRVQKLNNSTVIESAPVTFRCFTSGACGSHPEFTGLGQTVMPVHTSEGNRASSAVSFNASWQDDGRVLSCQPQGTKDQCVSKSIKLTVEYAPKETKAVVHLSTVKEGQPVTLTCSSRGHPNATYSWFKDSQKTQFRGTELLIQSTTSTHSGNYYCEAVNQHGTQNSNVVTINVKYAPVGVHIETNKDRSTIKEGDKIKLTCVAKSNPEAHSWSWFKDNKNITNALKEYTFSSVQPDDGGRYSCEARNDVGRGRSSSRYQITVSHVPRNTHITQSGGSHDNQVKAGSQLCLTCATEAHPAPSVYTWYHHSGVLPHRLSSITGPKHTLLLVRVGVTDEGCYICRATNDIGTGQNSSMSCFRVLYGPTKPVLSMVRTAQEGHLVSINCTVQSFPDSQLTLTWTPRPSVSPMSSSLLQMQPQPVLGFLQHSANVVRGSFNVTFLQGGVYTCRAQNSEGRSSTEEELEITYSPKNVMASAHPDTVLTENSQLVLTCTARSNPHATKYTWIQISAGETRVVGWVQKLTVMSTTPSHSGLYRCTVQNSLGTGKSQQVEVKVKYAPKLTKVIHNMTNRWQSDGESPVALTCHSHSYPPVNSYKWYRLVEEREHFIINHQNITVHPDKPGTYYCVATNDMGGKESGRVELFLNRSVFHVLSLVLPFCCVPLVLLLIFLVYRHKRIKSIHQGTSHKLPCCVHFGFLGWRNGTSENLVSEGGAAASDPPGSSRDQLYHPYHPEPLPQPQHPHPSRTSGPDSTSTSDIYTAYSVLKVPGGKQGLSPSHPIRNKDEHTGHTQEPEVNYASLQFRGQEMGSLGPRDQAREDDVYAKVGKPKLKEKTNKCNDYENIKEVCASKPTIEPNMDTEMGSSEDDVEISYSEVMFRAKPGHQTVCSSDPHQHRAGHSSSSDEEDYITQYSDVKI
uniref:B-cell receptor CD22 isoform X1 n=2 Tax=Oncorhynchus gorbuscha TaxID=8017 RepID=UPI001EAF2BD4|nr:B-cell receptor CD22 isoform X1 [Oncorhynchus gorbuscha]